MAEHSGGGDEVDDQDREHLGRHAGDSGRLARSVQRDHGVHRVHIGAGEIQAFDRVEGGDGAGPDVGQERVVDGQFGLGLAGLGLGQGDPVVQVADQKPAHA